MFFQCELLFFLNTPRTSLKQNPPITWTIINKCQNVFCFSQRWSKENTTHTHTHTHITMDYFKRCFGLMRTLMWGHFLELVNQLCKLHKLSKKGFGKPLTISCFEMNIVIFWTSVCDQVLMPKFVYIRQS
jgi:hypothetical protein